MLQFLVGGGAGNEETMSVTGGETTDDSSAADGGVDDGHDVGELGFKDRVKVCRRSESCETVALDRVSLVSCSIINSFNIRVGELGEDTNVCRVFELGT